jgi:hypothetical protein
VILVNSENPDKEVLEPNAASLASTGISPDVIVISPIDLVELQVAASSEEAPINNTTTSSGRTLMPL